MPLPDHPADRARRAIILEALCDLAGREKTVKIDGFAEWDRQIGLMAAVKKRHGPWPTIIDRIDAADGAVSPDRKAELDSWAEYNRALQRARLSWESPAFLSGVITVLREVGFPDAVAALVGPGMLCVYVEWADHNPPCAPRYWYRAGQEQRIDQRCPLRNADAPSAKRLGRGVRRVLDLKAGMAEPAAKKALLEFLRESTRDIAAATTDRTRRGPKDKASGHTYQREAAQWYFEVEVEARRHALAAQAAEELLPERPLTAAEIAGEKEFLEFWDWRKNPEVDQWGSVPAIARLIHRTSTHKHEHTHAKFSENCGCATKVRMGILKVKGLLGLAAPGKIRTHQ